MAPPRPDSHLASGRWPDGPLVDTAPPEAELLRQICQTLKRARGTAGLSTHQVAGLSKIPQPTVQDLFNGKTWGTLRTIAALEKALGVGLWPAERTLLKPSPAVTWIHRVAPGPVGRSGDTHIAGCGRCLLACDRWRVDLRGHRHRHMPAQRMGVSDDDREPQRVGAVVLAGDGGDRHLVGLGGRVERRNDRRRLWVPIIRSWALTRGFALHPGTRNRYMMRYTRTQHRPA